MSSTNTNKQPTGVQAGQNFITLVRGKEALESQVDVLVSEKTTLENSNVILSLVILSLKAQSHQDQEDCQQLEHELPGLKEQTRGLLKAAEKLTIETKVLAEWTSVVAEVLKEDRIGE